MIPNNLITNPEFIRTFSKLYLDRKSESQWRSMMENARPYFVKARGKFRGFFDTQLDECVRYVNSQKAFTKAVEAEQALDWDQWVIQFEEYGQLLLSDIIAQWGPEILGTITTGISFDTDFPYIEQFIKDYSYRMAVNVNDTTKQQLRDLFTEATDEGYSVPQIEKKLRELFTNISKVRANMIARSEVIRAHNAGAEAAYIESGVVQFKQWWSSKGERRTCRFCAALHGKVIPVGDKFFDLHSTYEITDAEGKRYLLHIDYSDIRFPPLHVRCRCTLIPIV